MHRACIQKPCFPWILSARCVQPVEKRVYNFFNKRIEHKENCVMRLDRVVKHVSAYYLPFNIINTSLRFSHIFISLLAKFLCKVDSNEFLKPQMSRYNHYPPFATSKIND